ncbi:MAG: protein translocase subunit SecF [Desulfobacterales bacterium]|nr:protein translocase subunit SecF [Desulfobacterales bacterium]
MKFIRPDTHFDFVGKRKIAYTLSLSMIIATIVLLIGRGGPNYGVDFTGGAIVQVKFEKDESLSDIKEALRGIGLEDSIIQEFENSGKSEYLIRLKETNVELAGLGEKVREALTPRFGQGVDIRRVDMVGPQVGEDLRQKALLAIFYSILLMAVYISGRFELKWAMSIIMALSLSALTYILSRAGVSVTWLIIIALLLTLALCWVLRLKYALGAIIALIHDVTITVGAFALTNREISLSIIAALLTIVGYSLNDTIIIFDRIRENLGHKRNQPLEELINSSVNQTLSRTILTSGTTLIVVVALFLFGGGVIHDFAFALLVGFIVGTYSTIYVASPILIFLQEKPGRKSKPAKA